MRASRLTLPLAAVAVAGLSLTLLTACSSSSGSAASASAPSKVGGMTECTKEVLQTEVDKAMAAAGAGNVYTVDSVSCDSGWAVTSGVLGPKDAPSGGPQGTPTPMIFQAEGQFWIPKDAKAVCGTNYATATAAPSDAQIPPALFTAGCLAG